ncbi:MAG TPA: hypothetical protein V6D17_21070 [Candidatus Obscuribacterales bacterium]
MADAHDSHAHEHGDEGHGGHGGHGHGEEFVPTSSLHDLTLIMCCGIALAGLLWMMYFWGFSGEVKLAEVVEHGAGHGEEHLPQELGH